MLWLAADKALVVLGFVDPSAAFAVTPWSYSLALLRVGFGLGLLRLENGHLWHKLQCW
jgi:hypothetical protein